MQRRLSAFPPAILIGRGHARAGGQRASLFDTDRFEPGRFEPGRFEPVALNRSLASGLGGLAVLLAGVLVYEYLTLLPAPETSGAVLRQSPTVQPANVASRAEGWQEWVPSLLGRPVFSATRRPRSAPAAVGKAALGLPRLSGVLVAGSQRRAIFAAPTGGKAIVVAEGGRVGDYAVQSIAAGSVTLLGPGGPVVLRPTFDPSATARPTGQPTGQPTAGAPEPEASPGELGRRSLLDRLVNNPSNQRPRP